MILSIGAISLIAIIRFSIALRQWCPVFWSSIAALASIALAYSPVYSFTDSALGNRNFAHLLSVILTCISLHLIQDAWSRGFSRDLHRVLKKTAKGFFFGALALLVILFFQGSYEGSTVRPEAAFADDMLYACFRVASFLYCAIATATTCAHAAQISKRADPDEIFAIKLASASMGLACFGYLVSVLVRISPFVGSTLYGSADILLWTKAATQGALIVSGAVFSAPTLMTMRSWLRKEAHAIKLHRKTRALWLRATEGEEGVLVLKGRSTSAQAAMHRMIVEIWDAHSSSKSPELVLTPDDIAFVSQAEGLIRAS